MVKKSFTQWVYQMKDDGRGAHPRGVSVVLAPGPLCDLLHLFHGEFLALDPFRKARNPTGALQSGDSERLRPSADLGKYTMSTVYQGWYRLGAFNPDRQTTRQEFPACDHRHREHPSVRRCQTTCASETPRSTG